MDSVTTLKDALRQCRTFEAGQLEELARTLLPHYRSDPHGLIRELLRRGWLTEADAKGLVLESYLLLDRLGEGGMGQVFKARNKFGKVVALKLIRKDLLANPTVLGRFRREIEATAQFDHPNIIRAYDAGETDAGMFIVMEYVEGADLNRLVREHGPLPPVEACDCIRQAALGLQHAHAKGLIHRDVKPGNLLRATKDHVVKLLDLGLARLQDQAEGMLSAGDRPALTQLGVIVGTIDFLAPEQARDSRRVDARADLYSLGCTFCYLLTGRPPFPGGTPTEKLFKHSLEPPPLLPQMPPRVVAVLHRLLAKKPEDRYQTAAQVAAALAELLAQPDQLRTGRSRDQLAPTVPLVELPTALVAVPRAQASKTASRASTGRPSVAPPAKAASAKHPALPLATIADAVAPSRVLGQTPAPVALLVLDPVPVRPSRRRRLKVGVLALLLLGGALVGTVLGIRALTPSGPTAEGTDDRSSAGQPVQVLYVLPEWDGPRQVLAWSPEGRRLAFAAGGKVHVCEGSTGASLLTLSQKEKLATVALAWGPEGSNLLAAAEANGRIRVWELHRDAECPIPKELHGRVLAFAGNTLAIGIPDKKSDRNKTWWEIALWDTLLHQPQGRGQHDSPVVALASAGHRLASADAAGVLKLWAVQEGHPDRLRPPFLGQKGPLKGLALRPDGGMLASAGPNGIFLWDTATGKQSHVLPVNKTAPVSLVFGPGNRLVWAGDDGRLHLCDVRSGTEKRVLPLGGEGLRLYPAFRGCGLSCAASNGAVYHFPLSVLDAARVEEVLGVLLSDSRPGVRLEAIRAVDRDGISAAAPALAELLTGKTLPPKERQAVEQVLLKLKPKAPKGLGR